MHRLLKLTSALLLVLGITACPQPPPQEGEPFVSITATPPSIDDKGQTSTLRVSAEDGKGAAGTGSVVLTAAAGLFENDQKTVTLTLADGMATTVFKCPKAQDASCKGPVSIQAEWDQVTAKVNVQVATSGGGGDGGTDGGTNNPTDGGSDGGSTTFRFDIQSDKPALVAGTGDRVVITATVTRTAGNTPVADGTPITFTTDKGSFAPEAGTRTTTVNAAGGKSSASLYVANDTAGTARVTLSVLGESHELSYPFLGVSSMFHVVTTATKAQLGLESSGRETTTPITFKLINAGGQAVPDIDVSFEVSGAAGASVTPSATTDSQGQATTTLRAGNSVGVAIVKATVTATRGSVRPVDASHPGTPIVGGKPSDVGFTVDCDKKNLGALHGLPAPREVTSTCKAKLVDRFGTPVGLKTPVQWYPEAGSINSPVDSKAQTGSSPAADTGEASTIFTTKGIFPPYEVPPMAGEKSIGDRNPRDMVVTVIAVVAGEEYFADGSGPDKTLNGRWDPGEWFVDLGEPLVDRNDNGVWDSGEFFIDTERIDCTDPSKPASRNGKWDGPNGCWDGNTQIWRPIHLVYSGTLDPNNFELLTPADTSGMYNVPLNGTANVHFRWGDAHSNQMSPDTAGFTAQRSGSRGQVEVLNTASTFGYGGFNVDYNTRVATTQSDGTLTIGGLCDTGAPTPPGSETSPVATRCVRTVDFNFTGVGNGNVGTIRMTGATGTTSAPATSSIELRANHGFSPSVIMKVFDAVYQ
ncbi:hypothetical protein [Archangium lansingense]|uniref:Big-1 domain-containing protein n=1 Tax=Archangium lansingense TaxID=2995310 RepID=A0ABT4AID9_9BACT|nr:hypothetical protein [Archangium lansinium]MCY1081385.1 hypothetical protein [Archangium lansinium]